MPDTIQELEQERQRIFRQIDELGDFGAGSFTPTTGQNPDLEMRRRYLCHERLGVLKKD